MDLDVVLLPRDLRPEHLAGRAVVVFDVLRATTSMTAALAAGVQEIRVFGDLQSARDAADRFAGPRLLCGEERCLTPAGFDLGNSPGAFVRDAHGGRVALMSTTNGTRAILAARPARAVFTGALVNASAVARALDEAGLPVTLLCAGTNGEAAMEDLLGAGAVLNALSGSRREVYLASDTARVAARLFAAARDDLTAALRESAGGRNVIAAGLPADIDYAARLDALDVVGVVTSVEGEPPVVRAWQAGASRAG